MDDVSWFLACYHGDAYRMFYSQVPEELDLIEFADQRTEDAVFFCDYVINQIMMQITPNGYRWGKLSDEDPVIGFWLCTEF